MRDGQLGHGDWQSQWQPKKVEAFAGLLAGQRIVAVSGGGCHSLALAADGDVWSLGYVWMEGNISLCVRCIGNISL